MALRADTLGPRGERLRLFEGDAQSLGAHGRGSWFNLSVIPAWRRVDNMAFCNLE